MSRYFEMARDILCSWGGDPAVAAVRRRVIDRFYASGRDQFAVLTAVAAISDDAWAALVADLARSQAAPAAQAADEATLQRWLATNVPKFVLPHAQGGPQ